MKVEAKPYSGSAHLMCTAPVWGLAGFLGCSYFAWISFSRVVRSVYDWPHDLWTAATYAVWILLLAGLAIDTRCPRERAIFSVLVINFVAGFWLTMWASVPPADVRIARIATGSLWAAAALLSLATLGNRTEAGTHTTFSKP